MVGLFLGTVCLVALIATLRRRHGYRHYAYGGWGGPRAFYEYDEPPFGFRRGRHWGGRRQVLRELFVQLDTTPGQEKAIVSLLHGSRERLLSLRAELRSAKRELAALIGSDVLDVAALEALLAQQQQSFESLRSELVRTISSLHEVLDTSQRRELGALLGDGSLGQVFYRAPRAC